MKEQHAKPRRFSFRKLLLCIAAAYLALIAVGAGLFWGYLRRYEQNHPVGAMNAYFAALQNGEQEKIFSNSRFSFSDLNTQSIYWDYLQEKYAGGDRAWQYAEQPEENGKTVYDVYADNRQYGTLYLEKQDDGWHVSSDYILQKLTVIAAGDAEMNGVPLAAYYTGPTPVEAFSGTSGNVPALQCYSFHCLKEGTFTLDGKPAKLERDADGTVRLYPTVSDADATALKGFAETVSRVYAAYISGDAELSQLTAHLESGTDFLRQVRAYSSYYYNKHISIDFQNMQVSEPVAWSQDTFTVDASFDFIVRRTYDSHTYPTHYRLACRRTDSGFAVVNIQTL